MHSRITQAACKYSEPYEYSVGLCVNNLRYLYYSSYMLTFVSMLLYLHCRRYYIFLLI